MVRLVAKVDGMVRSPPPELLFCAHATCKKIVKMIHLTKLAILPFIVNKNKLSWLYAYIKTHIYILIQIRGKLQ